MSIEKFNGKFTKEDLGVTQIPTKTLQQIKNIDALGVYVYLASKPDNWNINPKEIRDHFNIGKNKTYKILNYLIATGYLIATEIREKGKFVGVEYFLLLRPIDTTTIDDKPCPQKPDTEKRGPENGDYTKHREIQNLDFKKEDKSSSSSSNDKEEEEEIYLDDEYRPSSKLSMAFMVAVVNVYMHCRPQAQKHSLKTIRKDIQNKIKWMVKNWKQYRGRYFTLEDFGQYLIDLLKHEPWLQDIRPDGTQNDFMTFTRQDRFEKLREKLELSGASHVV